jgi:biotin-(acetyl-CoA carboxylase) ligase
MKNSKYITQKYDYVVVTTDRQATGKGRNGTKWEHSEGNLACSIGLTTSFSNDYLMKNVNIERYKWVPLIMGYSVNKVLGQGYKIKWPNDIYSIDDLDESESIEKN